MKGYNPTTEHEVYVGVTRSNYYTRGGQVKRIRIDEPTFKKGKDGLSNPRQVLFTEAREGDVVRIGRDIAYGFDGMVWKPINRKPWIYRVANKMGITFISM